MAEIKNILVLGTGLMGNGIGQVALMAGYNVIMVDIKDEYVNKSYANIEAGMKKLEEKGKFTEGKTAADYLANLKTSIDIAAAVKDADIIIEAVVEDMNMAHTDTNPLYLWFVLVFSGSLGGGWTPFGSAAGILAVSILAREGRPLSFKSFISCFLPISILLLILSVIYLSFLAILGFI